MEATDERVCEAIFGQRILVEDVPHEYNAIVDTVGCRSALCRAAADPPCPRRSNFRGKAGDRIRTGDVQLGKLTFYH